MSWLHSLLGHSSQGSASPGTTGEAGPAENRIYGRVSSQGLRFRLFWQDERGRTRNKRAKVLDLNRSGALVECSTPLPVGSFVYIRNPELGMMGSARVRRCDAQLFSYQIGLYFAAPLTYRF